MQNNPWVDQNGGDSTLGYLFRVGKDRNPIQETQYQQLLKSANLSSDSSPSSFTSDQANSAVTAAQNAQLKANQPAIATLTGQQSTLKDQYSELLKSVTGEQDLAEQSAEKAVNTSLGQRGVDPNSVLGQQEFTNGLLPIRQQYLGVEANAQQGSISDLNGLASSIAQLQTGNVPNALTYGANIAGVNQQAAQLAANIPLIQAQTQQAQAQARYVPIPGVGVYDTQGKTLLGGISNNNLSSGGFQILGVK